MAPKRKAATKKTAETKKVAENGKVTKAAKPKRVSEAAKADIKATAVEASPKAAKAAPKKKPGGVDAYILFEVCKSCHTYKRNANQIFNDIVARFPKKSFELVINDHGISRRGSFEITVSKKKTGSAASSLIWSGISKGPPRKLKFPESASLFESVGKAL